MAQLAMQQTMDEITDYLATIDEKLDDVLRAQKDAVLADMIGVDLVIEEAMTIREQVGRVSEVTWSKVQATSTTIARTQAYALRQLDALAEKLERKTKIGDLAEAAKEAEAKVQEWLAVLARCFQLQDAIAVLELDRVLDAAPDELDRHRLALRTAARQPAGAHLAEHRAADGPHGRGRRHGQLKVLTSPAKSRTWCTSATMSRPRVVDFHGAARDRRRHERRRRSDGGRQPRTCGTTLSRRVQAE